MDKELLKARKGDYEKVFNTTEGKRVLADLYEFSMVDQPRFVMGDSHQTAYNEGMARVGYRIKSILKQSPKDIEKIVSEYHRLSNYDPFNKSHKGVS